jgi:hypothetical protein
MTRRDIRAYLRGAVVERLITGWYQPAPELFVIAPELGNTRTMDIEAATRYCSALRAFDVAPRYRESEPAYL